MKITDVKLRCERRLFKSAIVDGCWCSRWIIPNMKISQNSIEEIILFVFEIQWWKTMIWVRAPPPSPLPGILRWRWGSWSRRRRPVASAELEGSNVEGKEPPWYILESKFSSNALIVKNQGIIYFLFWKIYYPFFGMGGPSQPPLNHKNQCT